MVATRQGSILSPHIFNIILCDFFNFVDGATAASYTGDTKPYSAKKTNDLVINEIENFSKGLFKWLDFSYKKINSVKSHILFSVNESVNTIIDDKIRMKHYVKFWIQLRS